MKQLSQETLRRAAGLLAGAGALMAGTAYATTRVLAKTAIDRQPPRILEKAGSRIAGAVAEEEVVVRQREAAQRLEQRQTERVHITADDGAELVGHWYPAPAPKRVMIAVHGWRTSWSRDFGLITDFAHERGCSVLFVEQRGQNNSGGDYIGFGVLERHDVRRWVDFAAERTALPIYLCGLSMGAATVLMCADLDLPDQVHGIIADCGFTSPDAIWQHIASNNLHMVYHLRRTIAQSIYEHKLQAASFRCSTLDALGEGHTPVLFIHGTADRFVPVEMTYQNYLACTAPKRLLIVPGAGHCMSYLVEPRRYEKALEEFWADFD